MILPLSTNSLMTMMSRISSLASSILTLYDGASNEQDDSSSVNLIPQAIGDKPPIDANGVVHVSTPILVLSAFPLVCIAFLGHRFELGLENALAVGIIRSFIQLMILGLILHPIFVMGMDWPWLVCLCELSSWCSS